jgi:hypothetical protein
MNNNNYLDYILQSVSYVLAANGGDHDCHSYHGQCIPNICRDVHEGLNARGINNFCIYFPINDELRVISFQPSVSDERRMALIREHLRKPLEERDPSQPRGRAPRWMSFAEYYRVYRERHERVFWRLQNNARFRAFYRKYTSMITVDLLFQSNGASGG